MELGTVQGDEVQSVEPTQTDQVATVAAMDSQEAYREMSIALAWTMLIITIVAVITNILSIFVYAHSSMRRTPINILLAGLSAIDLLLALLSIPSFIVPGFFTYYNTWTLELIMCYSAVFVYPLTSTTHTASVWTFIVIAVERWQAVKQGGRDISRQQSLLRRQRRRNCIYALLTVCFLSIAYNFVRFFEFELIQDENAAAADDFDTDTDRGENASAAATEAPTSLYTVPIVVPRLRNATAHPYYMRVYFVGLYLVTHFAVPFVCLVIVNGLTLHIVYVAKQRRQRLLTRRERKEHQTTRMMITVVVMFIVCYTLVFALNIIEAVDYDWFHTDENRLMAYALNDISNMLVITNAASAAFIYYVFNRRYRELCIAFISKLFSRLSSWFCWCPSCWFRRALLEFLEQQQRSLDRRRSTVLSTTTDMNATAEGFSRHTIEEISEISTHKRSFLVVSVPSRRISRYSTSSIPSHRPSSTSVMLDKDLTTVQNGM